MFLGELAFDRIYAEHRPRIHRYLTRLAGADEAEDLTQEVFIRVDRGLSTFDGQSSLSTWIYRIATNLATDRLRSRAFRQETAAVHGAGPDHCPNRPAPGGPSPVEDQVVRREMNDCIQGYVSRLPENYRAVLVLSELEGRKNGEVAAILGLSLATVKIRLHRARAALRRELAANCIFYRTDCNQLACEPKGPPRKRVKPLPTKKR